MYKVSVEASFSAAHRLKNYPGRCESLHGHNWRVAVTVGSKRLDRVGMVMDFREMKKRLNEVLDELDHRCLNNLSYFKRHNPTSENVARYVYQRMRSRLGASFKISKVTVWETDASWASYEKD